LVVFFLFTIISPSGFGTLEVVVFDESNAGTPSKKNVKTSCLFSEEQEEAKIAIDVNKSAILYISDLIPTLIPAILVKYLLKIPRSNLLKLNKQKHDVSQHIVILGRPFILISTFVLLRFLK
jgi:hypothetical protein